MAALPIVLATLWCLLALATSALAESAWVLWAKEGGKTWEPIEYANKEACEAALQGK